jgi:hypothetical protein
MPPPRPIVIRERSKKNGAVIIVAVITAVGAVVAAIITATGAIASASIASRAAHSAQDWRQDAISAGWSPKGNCQWQPIESVGVGPSGDSVKVLIHLLAAEYRWVYGSATEIEIGGERADLTQHIRNLTLDPEAKYVVAVGVASVEGRDSSQAVLAETRTDKLIRVIKDELHPQIHVHGLSLGRFGDDRTGGDTRKTASQRRVVVVEVLRVMGGDGNTALGDAVYDALRRASHAEPPFPINVTEYRDRKYTDHQFGRR